VTTRRAADPKPDAPSPDAPGPDALAGTTLRTATVLAGTAQGIVAPALTIAWHSDLGRVGERSRLNDPGGGGRVRLSRSNPAFGPVGGEDTTPLADPHLSRTPLHLTLESDGGVTLTPDAEATRLVVDGEHCAAPRRITPEALARGLTLELGDRVVLLLHMLPVFETRADDDLGLVGSSAAMRDVREQVRRVAAHDVPVLLRGESGTGKELVARAIHRVGERRERPFVAVNMAAVVPSTAASTLFGHRRGAFTGAVESSIGLFGEADGGTLFMDEIGDTPLDVQPALLRALESGEVQTVGGGHLVRDVRIVAATDADLEQAVRAGRFRLPLLQRLAGYEIHLPPLRERREDVPLLLLRFLRDALDEAGRADRLEPPERGHKPWLGAAAVARMLQAPWIGNVRELKRLAQRLVIDHGDADRVPMNRVEQLVPLEASPPAAPGVPSASPDSTRDELDPRSATLPRSENLERMSLREISEDALLDALRGCDFKPGPAARVLGISRTSIYELIDASAKVRKASELQRDDIARAIDDAGGDTRRAARLLEVSERALRLRMTQLDM
jgi:two-component system nitrogen regulation response regulator GlnG